MLERICQDVAYKAKTAVMGNLVSGTYRVCGDDASYASGSYARGNERPWLEFDEKIRTALSRQVGMHGGSVVRYFSQKAIDVPRLETYNWERSLREFFGAFTPLNGPSRYELRSSGHE